MFLFNNYNGALPRGNSYSGSLSSLVIENIRKLKNSQLISRTCLQCSTSPRAITTVHRMEELGEILQNNIL